MRTYGPPDVLTYAGVALPPLGPGEVRIRTIAAAVNHTDLEIRRGKWPVSKGDPFPYVPGVEVVGEVVELGASAGDIRKGDCVITMMQGLGGVRAERPGSYAEYVTVASDAVAGIPSAVDPYDMAAIGLVGVTAYEGLRRIGHLAGKRILVTGAAGGIGSAATAIARAQNAYVVGLVSRPAQIDDVCALGANEVIVVPKGEMPTSLQPESMDGVLDAIGGYLFGPCVEALRRNGVLSLVGAVACSEVRFDAWSLIRPVTLTGYSSETLNGSSLRNAITTLADWLVHGAIKPPARTHFPLAQAARAHALLERGGVAGRVLLVP